MELKSLLFLVWACIIAMVLSYDGYYITHITVERVFGAHPFININIEQTFVGSILWIFVALFPLFVSNYFKAFLLGSHVVIFLIFAMQIQSEFILAILLTFLFSGIIYHIVSIHQEIRNQFAWFNNNHKHISEYKYLTIIVYILIHVIVYSYCFLWCDQCKLISVFAVFNQAIPFTIFLYCTLPSNNAIQYQPIHFDQFLFMLFITTQLILMSYHVFYAYLLKDYLDDLVHSVIAHLITGFMAISYFKIPIWLLQKQYHSRFARTAHIQSWWKYITSNKNNFENFQVYLMNMKIFQNFLFLIEINEYKRAVYDKLNKMDIDIPIRYLCVEMDDYDSIKSVFNIKESYLVSRVRELNIEQVTVKQIKNDICDLYEKYISKQLNNGDDNFLFVTFGSLRDRLEIKSIFTELNDFRVVNAFDSLIKKSNKIMQLLYQDYIVTAKNSI